MSLRLLLAHTNAMGSADAVFETFVGGNWVAFQKYIQ